MTVVYAVVHADFLVIYMMTVMVQLPLVLLKSYIQIGVILMEMVMLIVFRLLGISVPSTIAMKVMVIVTLK